MGRSDAALLSLAESIADGTAIDWSSAEATASPDEQAIVRQLRVLSDLAVLHRSLPRRAEPAADPAPARDAAPVPAMGSWAHLSLVERLGGGTSGEVYRAWDRRLERDVALKLLRAGESIDDLDTSRITHEGRLLARIRHTNVITVYGVDSHDGRVGLWMELVRGVTLEQQLTAHGPLSAHEATLVGLDLCRALAAIHAAGLIHRDVKAQNVMREDGGRIVLMDLGTGRETGTLGPHTAPDLAGTPLYLAPELFSGADASERTDLYSLGVLLYHLVTGAFPVRATTMQQLHEGHRHRQVVRLRDARPNLPTGFVGVVERAIANDPQQRYATAGEFEAALARTLNDVASSVTIQPRIGWKKSRLGGLPLGARSALAYGGACLIAIAVMVLVWPLVPGRRALAPIRSIAVLPLVNLSGDSSQEYLADGITDMLIEDLARIHPLRVISRTSTMRYKGARGSLTAIARDLKVDVILEGSVQRSANRLRVSADLVHVASERHLWVDSYERDVHDVLSLQSELARTIVRQVQIRLRPEERAGFDVATASRQVDAAAQEAYLQGRYYWSKGTADGLRRASEYFREAARVDPLFARAFAGQADTYIMLPTPLSAFTAYPLARAAAEKAISLDPNLPEAHTSLALVAFLFEHDPVGAEAGFRRAIAAGPNYATAHQWYADVLSATGRTDEALAQLRQAKALDPLSASIQASIGTAMYLDRRYNEAQTELRASLELDSGNPVTYWYLANALDLAGSRREAEMEARRGLEIAPQNAYLWSELGRLAALNGQDAEARRIAADLAARSAAVPMPLETIAVVYAAIGDRDRAFEFMRRADQERSPGVMWAKRDPMLDSLRDDPRFADLLRRLRLGP